MIQLSIMDKTIVQQLALELQVKHSSEERSLYFHGESMHPFLQEGDKVVVRPMKWQDIRLGDIVTYRFEDKFPTRRVVKKTDCHLSLWCENWPARRFQAERNDVLGRAEARQRDGIWLNFRDRSWRLATRRALLKFYVQKLRMGLRQFFRKRVSTNGRA